jgi:predicted amidohydrolase YtcJ
MKHKICFRMPNKCSQYEQTSFLRTARRVLFSCVALGVVAFASSETTAHPRADVVYTGHFLTMDNSHPVAEAVAVSGDRIVAVGTLSDVFNSVGSEVRRVELPGTAVPGLADAHVHAMEFGHQLSELDLRGLSKEDIVRLVGEKARTLPSGSWIEGRGWDQGFWHPKAFPDAADLDGVSPKNPVILTRIDGHSVWLNSAAMKAAGIAPTATDPTGGHLMRRKDGSPSGVLVDDAVGLVTKVVPKPTHDEMLGWLQAALGRYVELGVTSIHDAGVDLEGIGLYKELLATNRLPLRAYVMALGTGATASEMLTHDPEPWLGDHRLLIRSFKVFLDGALGSRGAELLAPYSDAPNEHGLELMHDADFRALVKKAVARGYQVNAHAIGDKAVRRALDTFEAAQKTQKSDQRFRVEHASVIDPSDLPRFAQFHIIASVQPGFVGEYSRWAEDRVGPTRVSHVLPIADLIKSGAAIASGTDFPAADSPDPIVTLYALVTRCGADGTPKAGWHPEEKVDVVTALRSMTSGPAFAAFEENELGMITAGRLADMTVLSDDPRTVAPQKLKTLKVKVTIIGGKEIFRAGNNQD